MIDSSIDPDLAALERQESFNGGPSPAMVVESSDGVAVKIYHGRLAARFVRESVKPEEGTIASVPVPIEAEREDPLGHLQVARLSVAVVVVLVIYWSWIRQRRKVS